MKARISFLLIAIVVTAILLVLPLHIRPAMCVIEPTVTIYGNVTKDVIDMENIFLYTDDNGVNQTLQYTRLSNITVDVYKIGVEDAFVNKTVASATESKSTEVTGSIKLLTDSDGIDYILVTISNSSALAASSSYYALYLLQTDLTFSENSYLILEAKNVSATGNVSYFDVFCRLKMLDEGGEDHYLAIRMRFDTSSESLTLVDSDSDGSTDDVLIIVPGSYMIVQFKMGDISSQLGVTLVKIESVEYGISFTTAATLTSSYEFKVAYRILTIKDNAFKVNEILLNKTKTLSLDANKISSTLKLKKIADVVIPFKYIPEPKKYYDDNNYIVKYEWKVKLPDDSALSFSDVKLNYTKGSGETQELVIEDVDYTDSVKNMEAGETKTLISSLSVGVTYDVDDTEKYTLNEYYEISQQIAMAWYSPRTWLDWFLGLILAIVNLLGGFGATYIKRLRASIRTP